MSDPSDDAVIGQMMMYNAFGYDQDEIGEAVGWSATTVGKYLRQAEAEARAADDPERVFWNYVLAMAFDARFRAGVGAGLVSEDSDGS